MEILGSITELLSGLDQKIAHWMDVYGAFVYLILFVVIFLETNVLFGGPLPGDTLVVSTGAMCAASYLNGWATVGTLFVATVSGYFFNYALGYAIRKWWVKDSHPRLMENKYMRKARAFFRVHARASVFFARFIPFMRSFAPLTAGLAKMPFATYAWCNVLGGATWSSLYFCVGYFVTDVAVLSGNYWLIPPGIILLFTPAWAVNYFLKRKRQKPTPPKG